MNASESARKAAEEIGKDISDRRGLKWEWEKIDDDVKQEQIYPAWEAIIAAACQTVARIGIYTSAIIQRGDKFLLTRHVHIGEPVWLMPGGKPEPLENAKECLIRECREELAIEITNPAPPEKEKS